jgi:hypothetical protein
MLYIELNDVRIRFLRAMLQVQGLCSVKYYYWVVSRELEGCGQSSELPTLSGGWQLKCFPKRWTDLNIVRGLYPKTECYIKFGDCWLLKKASAPLRYLVQ